MDAFFHFLEVFAICVAALIALALILFFIVSHMPNSPMKQVLHVISERLNTTAAVALVGLPLQAIPEIDGIYDIGALLLLAYYWSGIFKKIKSAKTVSEKHTHIVDNVPKMLQLLRHMKARKNGR